MEQAIQFVTALDGVKLAVATAGTGPPLVIVPHWITHLELDWEVGRTFFERLASHHLLIRYDKRGSGLSDHHQWHLTPAIGNVVANSVVKQNRDLGDHTYDRV